MSSKIEQHIDQIEDYIDSCKYQAFSNSKIIVDREELEGLLEQLRAKTPEEIKHYQRIISNKEAILNDARKKAEELINEASEKTSSLINEHEIMQQAYAQANEVVRMASQQAQDIMDQAVNEANAYRASAVQYMDGLLADLEMLTGRTLQHITQVHNEYVSDLSSYLDRVRQNREELAQTAQSQQEAEEAAYAAADAQGAVTGSIPAAAEDDGSVNTDMFVKA